MRLLTVLAVACVSLTAAQEPGLGVLVNHDGSLGATFSMDELMKEWNFGPDSLNSRGIGFSFEAVLGSKLESLPNHLYTGLDGRLELLDAASNIVFDAAVRGVRVEATQDFRSVDLAFGADAALMHSSLLNKLANWISPGAAQGANPSELTLGWSYLAHAKTDTLGPGWNNRLDAGLFLSVPVTANLNLAADLKASDQAQDVFDFDTWRVMLAGVATVQFGGKWVHVMYQRGGVPPRFDPVNNWSVGFGFAFD